MGLGKKILKTLRSAFEAMVDIAGAESEILSRGYEPGNRGQPPVVKQKPPELREPNLPS